MRRVIILGATGSIGTTALGAIRTHHLPLKVVGLSAHARGMQLETLGKEFGARTVLIPDGDFSGLKSMLESTDADIVLNGISGFAGLSASMLALESGKDLALANKESVVCGSSFLFATARRLGRAIIPMFVGRANETDPSYTTSMLIFGFTALGAAIVAIAMWYVNRRKGYGLQQPNIQ